jgi:hypothetical protein
VLTYEASLPFAVDPGQVDRFWREQRPSSPGITLMPLETLTYAGSSRTPQNLIRGCREMPIHSMVTLDDARCAIRDPAVANHCKSPRPHSPSAPRGLSARRLTRPERGCRPRTPGRPQARSGEIDFRLPSRLQELRVLTRHKTRAGFDTTFLQWPVGAAANSTNWSCASEPPVFRSHFTPICMRRR